MIKRINLIEKQVFSFTYLTLAKICLGVILAMSLMAGWQFFQVYRVNKKVATAQARIDTLKADQKNLKAKPVKEHISIGEFQTLLDRMESAPQWSRILRDTSQRLPKAVWITAFKSVDAVRADAGDKKHKREKDPADKDKAADKAPEMVHRLEFTGQAVDVRNISEFLANLDKSNFLKNLTLTESEKDKTFYRFVIKSEARSDAK
jgi:Tfp pilus assembly protein PilN